MFLIDNETMSKEKCHFFTKIHIDNLGILWYIDKEGRDRFWDPTAFRPLLSIIPGKIYSVKLFLSRQILHNQEIYYPEKIYMKNKKKYINVR